MITEYELDGTRSTNRFLTSSKSKAFELRARLESTAGKTHWMVGQRIVDRIAIEVDSQDPINLDKVVGFYSRLFANPIRVIKTMHGYHLIQSHSMPKELLQLCRCKVLVPGIRLDRIIEYEQAVDLFFESLRDDTKELPLSQLAYRTVFSRTKAREAGLVHCVGDIDVMHALIGIHRHRYVLRISKKTKNDKMELIS